jgi:drug/metabolite transporter (DMT)-like permease
MQKYFSIRTGVTAQGVAIALSTPIFLGMAPIFGKLAYAEGADPFTVAATRTIVAVALLWLVYIIFFRKFIYIYPAGLLGCVVIGIVNGIGSLFYYGGLGLLDASLVQLLNGMYLVFAVLMSAIGGERITWRMSIRVGLALLALVIITGFHDKPVDWLGVGLMLGSALMFAGTVSLSQYVLYEMPSPTATLYIVSTMGIVVAMVWFATGMNISAATLQSAAWPILLLGLTTAASRLSLFAGVKFLGSLQTSILAITEIGVALALAFFVLGERLTVGQWVGVAALASSLLLVRVSDLRPHILNPGAILVENLANWQFQEIAFHRAFGTPDQDNDAEVMSNVTTQELIAIRRMMGADDKATDPFPIWKNQAISVNLKALLDTAETEAIKNNDVQAYGE